VSTADREARVVAAVRRLEEHIAAVSGRTVEQARAATRAGSPRWTWEAACTAPVAEAGRAPGELVASRRFTGPDDRDGYVVVEHADPVIWVSVPLMVLTVRGETAPQLTVEPPSGWPADQVLRTAAAELTTAACRDGRLGGCGFTFRVDAAGGWLVYAIGRYLPDPDVYECYWPD
jgi:hypothetical protein